DADAVAARVDGRVLGFAVDFGGHVADEPVHRRPRITHFGGDLLVDVAARDVADDPTGEAAFATDVEGALDGRFEVGVDLELRALELPALAFVADLERVLEGRQQPAADPLFGFGGIEAADFDAADRHSVGDRLLLRAIVGIGDRAEAEDEDPGDDS